MLEVKEEFYVVHLRVIPLAPSLLLGTSEVTVTIEDDDCKTISVISTLLQYVYREIHVQLWWLDLKRIS